MKTLLSLLSCLALALSAFGCGGDIGARDPSSGSDGGVPTNAPDASPLDPVPVLDDGGRSPDDGGPTACVTASSDSWRSTPIAARSDRFVTEADVTVNTVPTTGGIALSSGAGTDWADLAAIVLFDDVSGEIKARNGSRYDADTVLAYEAGTTYHIRMVVDVPRHRYSVYVQPSGGSEIALAQGYAFRDTQQSITEIDTWTVAVGIDGPPLSGCNFAVSDAPESTTVEYGCTPEAQTVYGGSTPIHVPAGYIHQTAWADGGGPDIKGVYACDFGGWKSMVWRWADTMRSDAIQSGHWADIGERPAYRFEIANADGSSPGTAAGNPRAEFFSVDPAATRREREPSRESIFRDGDEYWATFAMYLAEDFPTTHKWATLIQRKFQNGYNPPVDWFTLNAHRDTIDYTIPGAPRGTFADITTVSALRGRWTQFTFHERVSSGSDGYFAIYMDGVMVGEHHGPTIGAGDINFHIHYGYYRSNEGNPGTGVVYYSPFMIYRGSDPGEVPPLR